MRSGDEFSDSGSTLLPRPPVSSLGLVFAAVCVSLAFSLLLYPRLEDPLNLNPDPDHIALLAKNLADGYGYVYQPGGSPAVDRAPLYPFVLAAVHWMADESPLLAAQFLNAILHGLTALLVFLIASRMMNRRSALMAQALVAVHPILIWYTARIWIETFHAFLFTFAILGLILLATRPSIAKGLSAGVLLAASTLTKSIVILLPPLYGIFLVVKWGRRSIPAIAAMLIVCTLLIAPWSIRNYAVTSRCVPVHTSAGMNMIIGDAIGEYWFKHPGSTLALWRYGYDSVLAILEGTDHSPTGPDGDRILLKRSLARNLSQPISFIKRSAINMITYWYLGESPLKSGVLAALQFPLLICFIIGAHRRWDSHAVPPIVIGIGYYALLHSLIVGWARYSVPLIPVMSIFIVVVVEEFLRTRQSTSDH